VDFDGEKLGPVSKTFTIPRFDGERAIGLLPLYPLRHARKKDIRSTLIERGKMLLDVAGVKPMYYTGFALDSKDEVDSQVVVDFTEALAENRNRGWKPTIESVGISNDEVKISLDCKAECCRHDQPDPRGSFEAGQGRQGYTSNMEH
jgi:hypothetical protein